MNQIYLEHIFFKTPIRAENKRTHKIKWYTHFFVSKGASGTLVQLWHNYPTECVQGPFGFRFGCPQRVPTISSCTGFWLSRSYLRAVNGKNMHAANDAEARKKKSRDWSSFFQSAKKVRYVFNISFHNCYLILKTF